MKTYYIFVAIPLILTFLVLGIPQFTGRVFVNNHIEAKPSDWLSALILKTEKAPELPKQHEISSEIKVIKIIGNSNQMSFNNHFRFEKPAPQLETFSINESANIKIRTVQDTLFIEQDKGDFYTSIVFFLKDINRSIIFQNIKNGTVHNYVSNNYKLTFDNCSELTLAYVKDLLGPIDVNNGSSINIFSCNLNKLDLNIDNSMVNVDQINNIDSLNANLTGKSNIKIRNVNHNRFYVENQEQALKNSKINIYPTGNLSYYNLNK
ncbi:hypothetical protein [Sphingobacterium bovistauri]|uniref:Auto-transporter adhesin head GIN domain-containing protein n=1 Tax=Sphingobacterium bovistauri TaxID=2781959 RepID=A0ABS7Z6F1_9SPHI|nr:hypothetical protein [Sphingobacterium bovistauri]MCA5004509.1 hypothetical protein [Sphingobacterium bovistauri]